jgi:hypothetical protein
VTAAGGPPPPSLPHTIRGVAALPIAAIDPLEERRLLTTATEAEAARLFSSGPILHQLKGEEGEGEEESPPVVVAATAAAASPHSPCLLAPLEDTLRAEGVLSPCWWIKAAGEWEGEGKGEEVHNVVPNLTEELMLDVFQD